MNSRKKLLALGFLSVLVLSACGGEEETYSKEEVEKLVKEAVNEATQTQSENAKVTEKETTDLKEGNSEMIPTTEITSQQGPVRGAFNRYEYLPVLDEPVFTVNEYGYKEYEMNSPVNHSDLKFSVTEFEIVKYLESDFTTNIFRSEEGKSYVIVFIAGQNMGDRATTVKDNYFQNDLVITDKNGEVIKEYSDYYGNQRIAKYYLEQFGSVLDEDKNIERLGYFSYLLGYEVDDEFLQPGNILWLRQNSSIAYGGDEYKVPFYELENDFELPVVESQYKQ